MFRYRIKYKLSVLIFIISYNLIGQVVTVGSGVCGTSINSFFPANYDDWLAKFSWSASIYNKNNFTTINGTITSIEYFIDCGSCSYGAATNQKIYLGHITSDTFSNSNRIDNDTNVTDLTLVYSGDINWTDGGWNSISLTTNFNYDETKNLVVYFVNEHGGKLAGSFFCGNPSYIVSNFGNNTTKYARSTSSLPATGSLVNQVPVFKVHFSTTSPPVITMPNTGSICKGNTYTFSGVSVNPSDANLQWTSTNGGTFNDNNSLNPTYTPSTAETTAGTATLTLTATKGGNTSSKNFTLTIKPKPLAIIEKK